MDGRVIVLDYLNMELVFVTSNQNKVTEVQKILGPSIKIVSLKDLGFSGEIAETAATFKGNALLKANFIYNKFATNCFADDSGLEVEALNGEPGVLSARYAGEPANDLKNINKLIRNLQGNYQRNARFVTVIALIMNGKEHFFEGKIKGSITAEPRGHNGFGYDAVFCPEGSAITFAEMSTEEKNCISHRAIAITEMYRYLQNC